MTTTIATLAAEVAALRARVAVLEGAAPTFDVALDSAARTVTVGDNVAMLQPCCFRLLQSLLRAEGRPVEFAELKRQAWPRRVVADATVRQAVCRLVRSLRRQRLGEFAGRIERRRQAITLHTRGHRWSHFGHTSRRTIRA